MSAVVRMLRWYEKTHAGRVVGEAVLSGVRLSDLQAMFGAPASNPMYDCWPVGEAQVAWVSGVAGLTVDAGRYDYMIEADAADGAVPA